MIAPISLATMAHKYGGVLLEPDCSLQDLSIDSRSIDSGQAFVALKGDNFDGHEYLQAALEQGASALITERVLPVKTKPVASQWIVENSLRALGQIAVENRRNFTGKLIALTGSNGKTTVKEMIAGILRCSDRTDSDAESVLATKGNLNNHIGVPLTLLSLKAEHEFAVVEMGASGLGEIHYLTGLAKPDVALVNNVGDAHVGGFGSIKNIEIGKGEIFDGLSATGIGVVNLDSAGVDRYRDKLIGRSILGFSARLSDKSSGDKSTGDKSTGNKMSADIFARDTLFSDHGSEFRLCTPGGEVQISLNVASEHNLLNALAASACCFALGLSLEQIQLGLSRFNGVAGRMQPRRLSNGAIIIDDSYNASPSSAKVAITALAQMKGQTTFVLGNMGELGEDAERLHVEIGQFARDQGITNLIAIGDLAASAADAFGAGATSYLNKQGAIDQLLNNLCPESRILVKGSRTSRMEDVVNSIQEQGG